MARRVVLRAAVRKHECSVARVADRVLKLKRHNEPMTNGGSDGDDGGEELRCFVAARYLRGRALSLKKLVSVVQSVTNPKR